MTPNRTPSLIIEPWYNEEEVLPETVGKIYLETKARPRFIVSESVKAGLVSGDQLEVQVLTPEPPGDRRGLPSGGHSDLRQDG